MKRVVIATSTIKKQSPSIENYINESNFEELFQLKLGSHFELTSNNVNYVKYFF